MKVERVAVATDNVVPMSSFKSSCLNCRTCEGVCWHYRELMALPDTVLNRERSL